MIAITIAILASTISQESPMCQLSWFSYLITLKPHKNPDMRKQRHREVNWFAQGCTVVKWQGWDSAPDFSSSKAWSLNSSLHVQGDIFEIDFLLVVKWYSCKYWGHFLTALDKAVFIIIRICRIPTATWNPWFWFDFQTWWWFHANQLTRLQIYRPDPACRFAYIGLHGI